MTIDRDSEETDIEKKATTGYLARGRIFRRFSDDQLKALWTESVRLARLGEGGTAAVRQRDDTAAEMRLRRLEEFYRHLPVSDTAQVLNHQAAEGLYAAPNAELLKQIAEFHAAHRNPDDAEGS